MRALFTALLLVINTLALSNMNIYNDKAQVFEEKNLASNSIDNLPQTIIEKTFIIYAPKIDTYSFIKGQTLTLYDFWKSYKNKTVHYNNKNVILRYIHQPYALIELPNKKLQSVELKEILFPPYKGSFSNLPNHILLPKDFKGKVAYSYMLRGIHWKSLYTLLLHTKKAALKGRFEISNDTQTTFTLNSIKLIAGTQNSSMPLEVSYYKRKSPSKAMPMSDANIKAAPLQDYYSYTYNKKTTLPAKTKSFITFLDTKIDIDKKYTALLSNPKYFTQESKTSPQVGIRFKAPLELPYGHIIFLDENNLYLGDTTIPNTQKNVEVALNMGKDFFSVIQQRLIEREHDKRSFRAIMEYTLTNRSKQKRKYELQIPLQEAKKATIVTSEKYSYKNADTVLLTVFVSAGKEKRFRVTYEQRK